jgi:hypothetical protein
MAYITINTPQDIIDCILSVDNIFSFETIEELNKNLNSIGFFENKNNNRGDIFGSYLWFEGVIDNVPIALTIDKKSKKNSYNLMEKYFYRFINNEKVPHRDNDLPAFIWNDTYTSVGNVRLFHYYTNGEPVRTDPLLAPRMVFHDGKITYTYNLPLYENRPTDSILVYQITCENNKIIDMLAYYRYTELSLKQITEIIPRAKNFNLRDLANMKNELTSEENTLLHMNSI